MPSPERTPPCPDYIPAGDSPPIRPVRLLDYIPGITPLPEPGHVTSVAPIDGETAPEPVIAEEANPSPDAPANMESPSPPERQPRVTLQARVGAAPVFRNTPKGQLLAKFPLGVRPAPDVTNWHTILAVGARAEKLRDEFKLAKGDEVTVIGCLHTREAMNRKGIRQAIEEVYAVAIRTK